MPSALKVHGTNETSTPARGAPAVQEGSPRRTLAERLSAKALVAKATRQLNSLVNQKDRLIDTRAEGELDADEFLERKTRRRDEEGRLRLQLAKAERDREEVADLAVRTFELSQLTSDAEEVMIHPHLG